MKLTDRTTAVFRLTQERKAAIEVYAIRIETIKGKPEARVWAFESTSRLCRTAQGMGAVRLGVFNPGQTGLQILQTVHDGLTALGLRNLFE